MIHDPLERDAVLGDALGSVTADSVRARVDFAALRRATNERAAPELATRRFRRRMRFAVPASAAAGIALFVLVARAPERMGGVRPAHDRVATSGITIDELLDADVSDGQFRAVVGGATEANELLLIAAEDEPRTRTPNPEPRTPN